MAKLTKADAARQLGIARSTLYKLIDQGKVSPTPDGLIGSCTCILRVIPNARESGTIPPFPTCVRGHCHDIQPRFLPARADRFGVGVPDALRAVAIGARCSSTDATHASHATPRALGRPQTLYRPDP